MSENRPLQLTSDQVDRINASLRIIHDMLPQLDMLDSCDHPTEEMRTICAVAARRLTNYKQHFSPRPDMT